MSDADNIILITVDSLRADYCGFMSEGSGKTPEIDRMAEDGLVFANAIAPGPATHDSMPVVFSGEFYPRPTGNWSPFDDPSHIRDHMNTKETIADRLSRRGYETAAFTTNPWTSRQYGFDSGFDHFEDFMDVETTATSRIESLLERVAIDKKGTPRSKPLQLLLDWQRQTDMFQSWDTFYDDIVQWTENADEPYFVWIFLVDAHMPFLPVDEFRRQSRIATYASNLWLYLDDRNLESMFGNRLQTAYADTVAYVDDRIDQLTSDISGDDPVMVIHGDHGEEFGEYGDYGHGQSLSEELIRVPLVVLNGPSGHINRPFSLADLPKLIERLADGRTCDNLGQSVVQSRNFDPKMAVRGEDWKYVASEDEERLYCLDESRTKDFTGDGELLTLGRKLAKRWRNDEKERRHIVRAADEVVATERV